MKRNKTKRASTLLRTASLCAAGLWSFMQPLNAFEVERLRTEAVKNPVGIDVERPMFSWAMDAGEERGVKQTAYEIAVFSDAACTTEVWTSGRVESDRQIDVPYGGDNLQPSTRYYWTVTVWDNKGGEATSTEQAYFETGLMGSGWDGAQWIKATDTPLSEGTEGGITNYTVEADFEIDNISAGVIFAANDNRSHYFLWQINFETGYARFRPHIFRGDQQFATALDEIDLRPLVDVQLHQTHRLRIEVEGDVARTYIDDVLIDTRTNPDGGNYGYGNIGLWEFGAERAYYDNIVVTDQSGEAPEVLISEDFSNSANPFTSGTVTDGRLLVNSDSWYKASTGGDEEEANAITHYAIDVDFEIDNLSAGVIFAANDDHSHYYMWQVNLETGYPRFRPHVWRGPNLSDATCLAEIDLRPLVNVQPHQTYHLRIEVEGNVARTFIDDVLVDTRNEPDGGNYGYGHIGIRQDAALNDPNNPERAYFDNFTVTDLTDGKEEVLISEDFSSGTNTFSTGSIRDGRLYVEKSYAWYDPAIADLGYDLDLDVRVVRDNAGIIFSGYDTNNFHLWGINVRDKATPFLRRHVKVNGGFTYSDTDLGSFFTKADLTGSPHHVKISVRGTVIRTYIDEQLVDTYYDASGRLTNGLIGFRAYYDRTMNEEACYDNVTVTTFADGQGTVTFSEDFEGAGQAFSDGTIVTREGNKMLCVRSTYDETCALQTTGREKGIPLFRKAFTTKGAVKSAKLYASGLGVFDLFMNGRRVGVDGTEVYDELKPGWTDYRKEVNYMTYDVTPLMREGDNVLGAQVSNGWWAGPIAHGMYGTPALGFIAKLRIEYEDGSVEHVVTNTEWASSFCGPVMMGDIYNGETYDARRESNWTSPEYDASGWNRTAVNTDFRGEITAFRGQTVRVREAFCLTPKAITVYEGAKPTGTTYGEINVTRTLGGTETLRLKAGETALFDLGQNMTGWVRFTVKGDAGTKLRVKFGEMLNDTGASDRLNDGPGGSLYTYNLRTAGATLHYTLRGAEEGETFHPSNTFFGFRYCEVTTTSDVEITSLEGQFVGSDLEEHATFETSHPDVNQLYSNIRWSQRDNFLSIPTDCPQRDERLGWTGDIQVFGRTATYHADTRAFLRKWLNDLRQSQREDGAYPEIAPFPNFWGFGTGGWADAGVIVPWTVYLMTGDQAVLGECYASMTRYMDWLSLQGDGQYKYNGAGTSTGDWLSYENTDARYVCVCHYANVAQLMSKIAGALSQSPADAYHADSLKYAELYDNIRAEWQGRYLDGNGQLTISTQTSYLMALKFGLLPETSVERAREILRGKIENNGYKLSTGFIGTSLLCQTLSEQGMDDLAYDLLLQRENPSWLYSVDQGATTVWERWDSYTKEGGFNKHEWNMNSFNHYSYGVVAEWMFRRVAGIESDEAQPGFKHFFLMPTPDDRTYFPAGQERITSAKASHRSGYGLIRSEWERGEDGRIAYVATVPANTTATLYLPLADEDDEITEGGKPLEEAEGLEFKGVQDGKAVIELQSGTYRFNIAEGHPDKVEETIGQTLRIHPNPFHDALHITCDEMVNNVSVTASNGQVVCNQSGTESINTGSWTPGLYIVRVNTAEHDYRTKVIKE